MALDTSYYTLSAGPPSPGLLKISTVVANEATGGPIDSSSLPSFHAARPIA